jgi:MYXO-CTERM domain-containing protein
MKKFLLSAAVLTVSAGAAMASPISATGGTTANKVAVPGGNVGAPRGTTNTIVNINVANLTSEDGLSAAGNTVLLVDLGAAIGNAGGTVTMTSIGWDVVGEALGASWQSEMRFYFDDNIAPDLTGLFLRPLSANAPGVGAGASGGQIDLTDNAIANIVLPNGILRLELFESFDDGPGTDGIWRSGFLSVGIAEVPAPGAAAVFGLAGLAGLRRRR